MPLDDSKFWPEGCTRCKPVYFLVWMAFCLGLLTWGLVSAFLVLYQGLNITGMNDYYAFGLWIVADLAVIALGAGAFFTSFMTFVIRRHQLTNIVNMAVVIGFICYSGAMLMLLFDIGQPARGWFGFWHANVHSMLTEVMFCISTYLLVLVIEFVPLVLGNRQIKKVEDLHLFGHHIHRIVIVFAATGTFLSFFHQGSLGGLYGVLYARPFAGRTGILIWPWTFFLFILSAVAAGPSFTTLLVMITEKISGRQLTTHNVKMLMGKISGGLLAAYVVLKGADTIYWLYVQTPAAGVNWHSFYQGPYGKWLLMAELGVGGVLPAIMLLSRSVRENYFMLALAMLLNCFGATMNRFVQTIQALAIPVLPFEKFIVYSPTWQEWGIIAMIIGYGFIVYTVSYRYLPLFPQETKLNPVK